MRPDVASVWSPPDRTRTPLIHTSRMPTESLCVSANVAWSPTVADHVGAVAWRQQPTVAQPQADGDGPAHFTHGVLQRDGPFVAVARPVDDAHAADQDVDVRVRRAHQATPSRVNASRRVVAASSAARSGSTPIPGPVGTLRVLSSLSVKSGPATSWAK